MNHQILMVLYEKKSICVMRDYMNKKRTEDYYYIAEIYTLVAPWRRENICTDINWRHLYSITQNAVLFR